MNINAWLRNFRDNEVEYAVNMLNSFVYLNEQMTNSLFLAAFQSISEEIAADQPYQDRLATWTQFRSSVVVTHVVGEIPGPSKSGYHFSRKARQLLGIHPSRILEPAQALSYLSQDETRPILLVDDFVGSGDQMIGMWHRQFLINGERPLSLAGLAGEGQRLVIYCPLICTSYGRRRIETNCPELMLKPVHELGESYSYCSASSSLWPASLQAGAADFMLGASIRAGIVDAVGDGWKGYHDLGMGIAFCHGVPDATLPLFYWSANGWNPLIRRT